MRATAVLAVVAMVLAAATGQGCGVSRSPDSFEAARVVQNSSEFKRPKLVEFPVLAESNCRTALLASERWRQLESLGIIEVRTVREQGRAAGGVCGAVLTEEASREAGLWPSLGDREAGVGGGGQASAGQLRLPIAVRHLVRVASIRAGGDGSVEIDFTWQWQPNKIGEKLGVDTQPRTANSTLWLYSDGWRVVRESLSE